MPRCVYACAQTRWAMSLRPPRGEDLSHDRFDPLFAGPYLMAPGSQIHHCLKFVFVPVVVSFQRKTAPQARGIDRRSIFTPPRGGTSLSQLSIKPGTQGVLNQWPQAIDFTIFVNG